jgi:hypothetical protein
MPRARATEGAAVPVAVNAEQAAARRVEAQTVAAVRKIKTMSKARLLRFW